MRVDPGEPSVTHLTEPALAEWAAEIGRIALEMRVFVGLYGELGAGKSTVARAACRGAGVTGPVPSPTFTLVHQYAGRGGVPVLHADLYRIASPEELFDLGWEDLVRAEAAVLVEWADRAGDRLPADRWDIRLTFVDDRSLRMVTARALGRAPAIPVPPAEGGSSPC